MWVSAWSPILVGEEPPLHADGAEELALADLGGDGAGVFLQDDVDGHAVRVLEHVERGIDGDQLGELDLGGGVADFDALR